jgi:hypothetical protein
MVAVPSQSVPRRTPGFYFGFAIACALVAFLGFAPTYWLPLLSGSLQIPPLVHLHAALQFGWVLLFIAQAGLAGSGRLALHRVLGPFGVMLAAALLVFGVIAAIHSFHLQAAAGHAEQARAFMIAPISNILFFAACVGIAASQFRQPEIHKRLMVLATVSVLTPAIARVFLIAITGGTTIAPPPIEVTIVPSMVTNLLLVVAMVHDRRAHGRVHRVYWIGGGLLLATQLLRIPFAHTPLWRSIADGLIGLGAPLS